MCARQASTPCDSKSIRLSSPLCAWKAYVLQFSRNAKCRFPGIFDRNTVLRAHSFKAIDASSPQTGIYCHAKSPCLSSLECSVHLYGQVFCDPYHRFSNSQITQSCYISCSDFASRFWSISGIASFHGTSGQGIKQNEARPVL